MTVVVILFYLREGTRQMEMLAFPFAAATRTSKTREACLNWFEPTVKWSACFRTLLISFYGEVLFCYII